MVSRDAVLGGSKEEGCEEAELWVQSNMIGEATTMEEYPSVYPVMNPKVNAIANVARDPAREKDFDSELAREMNQLSVQERERKFEEMHGVSSFTEETDDLVAETLVQLHDEINSIPFKNAYDLAYQMDSIYVESRKFRLMFLRAELFDARKAAERLVLFLEKKLKFFGPATLVRSIQMGDLDDADIATLKAGAFQILPSRDRSGRPILFKCSNCGPKLYSSLLSYCRCWWYRIICAFEECEETQKRGAVVLVWWMDFLRRDPDVTPELRKEVFGAIRWLPMRPYNSIHICMDHNMAKKLLARVQIALSPPEIRYNYKIHAGSHTEVMYSLLSFGIPTDSIPVSGSGQIKTKDLHKWIHRRHARENFVNNHGRDFLFDMIDLPSLHDVLLAKGRPYQNHPGNVEYLQLINESLKEYDSSPNRKGKRDVIRRFVDMMRGTMASRFLTKDNDDWWVEAPEKEVHDKVMKSYSHASAMARKKSSPTTSTSSSDGNDNKNNNGNNMISLGKRQRIEPRMDVDVNFGVDFGVDFRENKRAMTGCFNESCFGLDADWSAGLGFDFSK